MGGEKRASCGGAFKGWMARPRCSRYPRAMTRTHLEVSAPEKGKQRPRYTPLSAAIDVEAALGLLEGRWKLVILFQLFDGKVQRFSDLEKRIDGISQKMLAQQ